MVIGWDSLCLYTILYKYSALGLSGMHPSLYTWLQEKDFWTFHRMLKVLNSWVVQMPGWW